MFNSITLPIPAALLWPDDLITLRDTARRHNARELARVADAAHRAITWGHDTDPTLRVPQWFLDEATLARLSVAARYNGHQLLAEKTWGVLRMRVWGGTHPTHVAAMTSS